MPRRQLSFTLDVPEASNDLELVINWLVFDVAAAAPAELLEWLLGRTPPPEWVELLLDLDDDELSETHLEMFRTRVMATAASNTDDAWELPLVTEAEAEVLSELHALDAGEISVETEPPARTPGLLDLSSSNGEPGRFAVFSTPVAGKWSGFWTGTPPNYRDGIAIRGDAGTLPHNYLRCTPLAPRPTRNWHIASSLGELTLAHRESRRGDTLLVDISLRDAKTGPGLWRVSRVNRSPLVLQVTGANTEMRNNFGGVLCIDTFTATITFGEKITVDVKANLRDSTRRGRLAIRFAPLLKRSLAKGMTVELQRALSSLVYSSAWPAVVAEAERATQVRRH